MMSYLPQAVGKAAIKAMIGAALLALMVTGSRVLAQDAGSYANLQPGTDFVASRIVPAGTQVKVIIFTKLSSDYSQPGDPVRVKVAPDDTSGVPKSVVFIGQVRKIVSASGSAPGEIGVRFVGLSAVGNWQTVGNNQPTDGEQASAHFYGSNSSSGAKSAVGIGAAAGAVIGGTRKGKIGEALEGGLLGALGGLVVQKATTHSASDIQLKQGQEVTITLRRPITIKTEMTSP